MRAPETEYAVSVRLQVTDRIDLLSNDNAILAALLTGFIMTQTSEAVDSARVLEHFRLRERQCLVEHRAYSKWLAPLTPLRWITVIGGIALSGLAGIIVLLCEYQRLSNDWRPTGGIFALVAAILTGVHTALNCDQHQAECHRLVHVFSSLEAAFQAARLAPECHLAAKLHELETKFEEAKGNALASAPGWCRRRAEAES